MYLNGNPVHSSIIPDEMHDCSILNILDWLYINKYFGIEPTETHIWFHMSKNAEDVVCVIGSTHYDNDVLEDEYSKVLLAEKTATEQIENGTFSEKKREELKKIWTNYRVLCKLFEHQ